LREGSPLSIENKIEQGFRSIVSNLKDRKARVLAQYVTGWFMDFIHHLPVFMRNKRSFLNWYKKQNLFQRGLLKNLSYLAGGITHALPDGNNFFTLFPAEVVSDLFKEMNEEATPEEQQRIVRETLPAIQTEMVSTVKNNLDWGEFFKQYVADIEEIDKILDADHERMRNAREGIKQQRAAWKARGWRRYL